MSLRIEENRKWSNKTFPHTLCVVSTSDETTHCGICFRNKSCENLIFRLRYTFSFDLHAKMYREPADF